MFLMHELVTESMVVAKFV